jgi:hypothetical protein
MGHRYVRAGQGRTWHLTTEGGATTSACCGRLGMWGESRPLEQPPEADVCGSCLASYHRRDRGDD